VSLYTDTGRLDLLAFWPRTKRDALEMCLSAAARLVMVVDPANGGTKANVLDLPMVLGETAEIYNFSLVLDLGLRSQI